MNVEQMTEESIIATIRQLTDELARRRKEPAAPMDYEPEIVAAFDMNAESGHRWMTARELASAIGMQNPSRSDLTKLGNAVVRLMGDKSRRSNGKKYRYMPPMRRRGQ